MSEKAIDAYIKNTAAFADKQELYLHDVLLPENLSQLDAVLDRMEYLKALRDETQHVIYSPDMKDTDAYEKILDSVNTAIGRFTVLKTAMVKIFSVPHIQECVTSKPNHRLATFQYPSSTYF